MAGLIGRSGETHFGGEICGAAAQGGQNDQNQNPNPTPQPGQIPPPGQRMTPEQAQQLLAAINQDMQTLQEKLGQILWVSSLPPLQDW